MMMATGDNSLHGNVESRIKNNIYNKIKLFLVPLQHILVQLQHILVQLQHI